VSRDPLWWHMRSVAQTTITHRGSKNAPPLFIKKRYHIYSGHTKKKNKESPTVRNCSNQEERRHDKTLAHTISVQTVTDGISRRVTSGREKNKVWYLSITESRLLRAAIVTWCCYNSYYPPCVRSQANSSSFSRTMSGACTWRLRPSTFFVLITVLLEHHVGSHSVLLFCTVHKDNTRARSDLYLNDLNTLNTLFVLRCAMSILLHCGWQYHKKIKYYKLASYTGLAVDSYLLPTSKSRDTETRTKIKNPAPASFMYCPLI